MSLTSRFSEKIWAQRLRCTKEEEVTRLPPHVNKKDCYSDVTFLLDKKQYKIKINETIRKTRFQDEYLVGIFLSD